MTPRLSPFHSGINEQLDENIKKSVILLFSPKIQGNVGKFSVDHFVKISTLNCDH